ncbi:MAG: hypothetical protein AMJ45_06315 [Syntrophobacter sp. DG_60]|nr:MAG: hypothetical protein AMJ45_06315 [Syntrophobacter sp. DG_60]
MKKMWLMLLGLFLAIGLLANFSHAKEEERGIIDTIAERIEFHGELEAGFQVDSIGYRGATKRTDSSRFDLITAGFAIEALVTDWITVTAVPLFEIDDFFIDEAHVTIGPTDRIPFYISGGIHYFPFGRREEYTHFPDDPFINLPITLYYGELQDPGFILGFSKELMEGHSFTIESYIYKPWAYACGPYSGIEPSNHADSFGFDVHYNIETADYTFEIGGSYTSNIAASSGVKDFFADSDPEVYLDHKVDAIAAYMSGEYRGFYFTAEYMQSVEPFKQEELRHPEGKNPLPHLWTFELGTGLEDYLASPIPVELMFRYAGSTEAMHIYEIPRNRWAVGLNIGIYDYATWSLAYAYNDYDPDYESITCEGPGENRHLFFSQIAVEF